MNSDGRDVLTEFERVTGGDGGLVSPALAAFLLGVTRQRVYALMEAGRFQKENFAGWSLIRLSEVRAYRVQRRSLRGTVRGRVGRSLAAN